MDSEGRRFSLIVATLGRTSELNRFLQSVEGQSHRDLEVLVVDQNPDSRIEPILAQYRDSLPIKHLRSATGLSRARNVALREVGGDIIAFPDDDCWYPADLLGRVADILRRNAECDGVMGRTTDPAGHPTAARWNNQPGMLNRSTVWRRGNSCSIFVRRRVAVSVGPFDETLGVGSRTGWESGEESDFLLRALASGYRFRYVPDLTVFHDEPVASYGQEAVRRGYRYGAGMGRVLRKHGYSVFEVAYHMLRPLAGSMVALLQGQFGRAKYHWSVFLGRARGWLS